MASAQETNFAFKRRTYPFGPNGTPLFFTDPIKNVNRLKNVYRTSVFLDEAVPSPALRDNLQPLQNAQQGIYTWIMLKADDSDLSNLYAMRVRSNQEIGTLHRNMLTYIEEMGQTLPFYASGELLLHEATKKIIFNMESSVFLNKVLTPLSISNSKQKEIQHERAVIVGERIRDVFSEYDVAFHIGKQLIETHKFLTHPDVIQLYRDTLTQVTPFDPMARPTHRMIRPGKYDAVNQPERAELPHFNQFVSNYLLRANNDDNSWNIVRTTKIAKPTNSKSIKRNTKKPAGTGTLQPKSTKKKPTKGGRRHKIKTRRNNRKK